MNGLLAEALTRRGVGDLAASVAAGLGALAMKIAYDRWAGATDGDSFCELARRALAEVRAATALS